MAQPTLGEIETFMYNTYDKNYKSKIEEIKDNNTNYFIDRLQFNFLTNILPFELNSITVKPSTIHGRGVFAIKDIKNKELITFYPGDVLEYTPNRDRNNNNHCVITYSSKRFKNKYGNVAKEEKYRDNNYAFTISNLYTIIGDPFFDKDPNYMGHFINDGAKSTSTRQSNEIYLKISLLKANCCFQHIRGDIHVAIVSTRDIKKDEELFIHYGLQYWESFNKNKQKL